MAKSEGDSGVPRVPLGGPRYHREETKRGIEPGFRFSPLRSPRTGYIRLGRRCYWLSSSVTLMRPDDIETLQQVRTVLARVKVAVCLLAQVPHVPLLERIYFGD